MDRAGTRRHDRVTTRDIILIIVDIVEYFYYYSIIPSTIRYPSNYIVATDTSVLLKQHSTHY